MKDFKSKMFCPIQLACTCSRQSWRSASATQVATVATSLRSIISDLETIVLPLPCHTWHIPTRQDMGRHGNPSGQFQWTFCLLKTSLFVSASVWPFLENLSPYHSKILNSWSFYNLVWRSHTIFEVQGNFWRSHIFVQQTPSDLSFPLLTTFLPDPNRSQLLL